MMTGGGRCKDHDHANIPIDIEEDMKFMSLRSDKIIPSYKWDTFDNISGESQQELRVKCFQDITQLIQTDLSEPYCIYTFRYFLYSWPWLCHFVYDISHSPNNDRNNIIGVIIGRIELGERLRLDFQNTKNDINDSFSLPKGYIAMLVVKTEYRGMGLGKQLVRRFISSVKEAGVSKIYLETETCNIASLSLYEQLGFVRTKFLPKYYWNGNDAYRLKLYL